MSRRRRSGARADTAPIRLAPRPGGGTLAPDAIALIADAAFEILQTIGLSDAPPEAERLIRDHGGRVQDGRVLFSDRHLRDTLRACGPVVLAAQDPALDVTLGDGALCFATGGAAPQVQDLETGVYRPAVLTDLYDAARLADHLPHIQAFARPLAAHDLTDPRALDLATAYACLAGTRKHVLTQCTSEAHLAALMDLATACCNGSGPLHDRPVFSLNINHVVPPLRFDPESASVLIAAARAGIPVQCNVFGQLGASSPVTLAGSVAQTMAECLAGLALAQAAAPGCAAIAGPRAMITDLRTGGLAGGSGEQLQATSACVAVARHWGVPVSVIAGATDAAFPDAQSGQETALSLLSAAEAGADLITQAAGSMGGLMGFSPAAVILDNDLIGSIRRSLTPAEVTPETLHLDAIRAVTAGEGHFLGRPETYDRMTRDFLFPEVLDRRSLDVQDPPPALADRARDKARDVLAACPKPRMSAGDMDAIERRFGVPALPRRPS